MYPRFQIQILRTSGANMLYLVGTSRQASNYMVRTASGDGKYISFWYGE